MNREKVSNFFDFVEPFLLYAIIFLQGTIQSFYSDILINFDNVAIFFTYLLKWIPSILLILYIINLKENYNFKEFGFTTTTPFYFFKYILLTIFLTISIQFASSIIYFLIEKRIYNSGTATFLISKKIMLIPTFLIFLMVGYLEEIFFRSYLITFLQKKGIKTFIAILLSSTLFATGHIYQGFFATSIIFLIGIVFSLVWIRTKNLHIIAISHTFFNFAQMVLLFFSQGI